MNTKAPKEAKTLAYAQRVLGVFTLFFNPFMIGPILTVIFFLYIYKNDQFKSSYMYIGLMASLFSAFMALIQILRIKYGL